MALAFSCGAIAIERAVGQTMLPVMNASLPPMIAPIESALGCALLGVTYWCLHHETDPEKTLAAKFVHGGFTEVRFQGSALLVSWAENARWTDHFSLGIEAGPASRCVVEGYHEPFEAGGSILWIRNLGKPLRWARLLGWNATPHALELGFELGAVVVADGYEQPLGDGDDVVHWPAEAFWNVSPDGIQCLWRSAEAPSTLPRS